MFTKINYSNESDEVLIKLYIDKGDVSALENLVNRYIDKTYIFAYRITKNHLKSEEVMQEVFLSLIKNIVNFRGDSKFSSWLYRITANASFTIIRSEKKRLNELSMDSNAEYNYKGINQEKLYYEDWSSRPDSIIGVKETLEAFDKAIDELPEIYRAVLHLRDIEGYTNEEVSEILELSIPAVKSRLHRARLCLREKVSDYFPVQIK